MSWAEINFPALSLMHILGVDNWQVDLLSQQRLASGLHAPEGLPGTVAVGGWVLNSCLPGSASNWVDISPDTGMFLAIAVDALVARWDL